MFKLAAIVEILKSLEKDLKEIGQIGESIYLIVKKYWRVFIVITIFTFLYLFMDYLVFHYPSKVIDRYYNLIDNGKSNEASKLLNNPEFESRWKDTTDFSSGYSSTIGRSNLKSEYIGDEKCVFYQIFSSNQKLVYKVTYVVTDRFNSNHFKRKECIPSLICQIAKDYFTNKHLLNSDTLVLGEYFRNIESCLLVRSFTKNITISKDTYGWKIDKIETKDMTVHF